METCLFKTNTATPPSSLLSRSGDDSQHKLSADTKCGSASFSEEIVSLLGISPPPFLPRLCLFLTLHISERTEWAGFFIGPLNDPLKGAAMNGWRGRGGMRTGGDRQGGVAAVAVGWAYCAAPYAATAGRAIHRGGREVGRQGRRPQYQHATAAPGSCISHAWLLTLSSPPLLVREESQPDGLRGPEHHTEFNRLRNKEQRGH